MSSISKFLFSWLSSYRAGFQHFCSLFAWSLAASARAGGALAHIAPATKTRSLTFRWWADQCHRFSKSMDRNLARRWGDGCAGVLPSGQDWIRTLLPLPLPHEGLGQAAEVCYRMPQLSTEVKEILAKLKTLGAAVRVLHPPRSCLTGKESPQSLVGITYEFRPFTRTDCLSVKSQCRVTSVTDEVVALDGTFRQLGCMVFPKI